MKIADELARVHEKLQADGRAHFVPLLTAASLRSAIRTGRESYSALGGGKDRPGGEAYVREVIGPLLDGIVTDGMWPTCAALDFCYEQEGEDGVMYRGLGVSLEIKTPGQTFSGFSLAILDLWYGRFV
jgi:hypothetical protein